MQTTDPKQNGYYAAIDDDKRMYNRRLCFLPEGVSVPGHPCVGPNRVAGFDGFFRTTDIFSYIADRQLQPSTVAFADIWHQLHYPEEREHGTQPDDQRYRDADVSYPGILAPILNPDSKPYRMLDGRRRLWKLENSGATEGLFYIIPEADVFEFFWMVMPLSALRQMLSQMPA